MTARRYDLDAMQAFITLLDEKITALDGYNEDVKRSAEAVLAQFTGSAADAYYDSHDNWQKDAATFVDEIRALRERITVAHRNYVEAEQANREMRA
ncbi:WXG100 family type VII secretion target [Nocardia amikacinitolerans]|uniref:WXG100 family type VII secretion target n=1 Tax=Nocardia amikacinitolerans TaxID=756689 RepID=UPI00369384A4